MAAAVLLIVLYAALCGGIWLRQRRQQARARQEAAVLASARDGVQPLLIAFASQTGQAEELARETARLLHTAGEPVHLCALNAVDAALLARTQRALFVASTYGEGDAPDNAALFQSRCMGEGAVGALITCISACWPWATGSTRSSAASGARSMPGSRRAAPCRGSSTSTWTTPRPPLWPHGSTTWRRSPA